jgi:lincosamide nucleotidyltransferase A/C/D/E
MTAADAIDLYTELQALGINVWIDGGWGVDALLGAQTRPHKDLDIAIEEKDVLRLTAALKARGYREVIRHSQWNLELSDDRGRGRGYELKEKDFRDVSALCEKFGIELPQE